VSTWASAQTISPLTAAAPPSPLAFEVASIRPHQGPLQTIMGFSASGPSLTLEGYNLRALVMEAYHLRSYRISFAGSNAGPDEQQDTNYDIIALAGGNRSPTTDEFRQMLQALLADRFHLRVHRETKQMTMYALTVAKGGPKFKPSAPDAVFHSLVGVHGRNQNLTATKITMELLADDIEGAFGPRLPVVDKTGLTGAYDLKFEATPEYRINNNSQPEDISLFDVVQEQLGLKLESQKANIEVLVVDHIDPPSEN
jgi:uncharacterized protein (TIGR03435 family)